MHPSLRHNHPRPAHQRVLPRPRASTGNNSIRLTGHRQGVVARVHDIEHNRHAFEPESHSPHRPAFFLFFFYFRIIDFDILVTCLSVFIYPYQPTSTGPQAADVVDVEKLQRCRFDWCEDACND